MRGLIEVNELLIEAMFFLELQIGLSDAPISGVTEMDCAWCAHALIQKAQQGSEIHQSIKDDIDRIKKLCSGPELRLV